MKPNPNFWDTAFIVEAIWRPHAWVHNYRLGAGLYERGRRKGQKDWTRGREINLLFILDPRQWSLYKHDHFYYDGNYDMITIGPFAFSWNPISCKDCEPLYLK